MFHVCYASLNHRSSVIDLILSHWFVQISKYVLPGLYQYLYQMMLVRTPSVCVNITLANSAKV